MSYLDRIKTIPHLKSIIYTFAFSVLAGFLATLINMPLPWMLGPLIGTMILSFAGFKMVVSKKMRSSSRFLIGILLGSTFSAETLSRVSEWPLSLSILLLSTVVIILVSTFYLIHVAKFDRLTALSASLPGALSTIPAISIQLGADPKRVVLPHLIRITLIVMLVPTFYSWWQNTPLTSPSGVAGGYDMWGTNLWVIFCAIPGWYVAKLLRLPIPELTGSMMVTAGFALMGYPLSFPDWLFALTFILLGSAIGVRVYGMKILEFFKTGKHAFASTALTLLVTLCSASLIYVFTDIEFHIIMLAVMPGGIAEMTILAAVLGVDPVFVAFHQISRSLLLNLGAPFIIQYFGAK